MVGAPDRLRPRVRALVQDPATVLYLSASSIWEMATKARLGRFPEAVEILADLNDVIQRFELEPLSITPEHAHLAGALPGAHRDPFDRMLIAQAMVEHLPIVTRDPVFQSYDVEVVW